MGYQQVELTRPADFVPKEHTSASQIGQFAGCQRQWAFRKLVGLREVKPRPWLEFGKEVEHYIQKYLEGYAIPQDVEAGRRALAGLHLLPDPKTCEEIVHQETICIDSTLVAPHLEKIQIEGAKDLVIKKGTWRLFDYKTTRGNTRRKGGEWDYVKTQDQLLSDVQANLYAWDIFGLKDLKQITVHARWIYLLTDQKKHPDARATDVVFTYDETRNRVSSFLELADQHRYLVRAYKHSPFDVNTLPGNADQCETFGGCPYRPAVGGPCKQPSRSLGAMLKMNPNGIPPMPIEDFLAQKRAEGLAAGAPTGYPAPSAGLMPPPPQTLPAPAPQIPTYQVGQIVNGHQFGPDGQWHPVRAPQVAPPAPHLPPEAYQPPMPSPMAAPVQAPVWAPPGPGLPAGVAAPPAAAPAKRGRPRKSPMGQELPAASPGTTEEPAEETDDRAQFIRACVLAVSGDVAIQDPARVEAMAKLAVQYASLVWQYLSHAGA